MSKNSTIDAWHFIGLDRRLRFKPHTLVEAGQTLKAAGRLVLCDNGMHASRRAIDALKYAPGPVVCRVTLSGAIVDEPGEDKLCARARTVLWLADATSLLHEWGCWCAEEVLKAEQGRGREPDQRSWAAIAAKRDWLRGAITDDQLKAAWSAAWSAAESAARSAAWSAARSAAWSAAESAAESAAWSAAESAARSAARSAAWSAAWSALNEELERRLTTLAPVQVPT